MSWVRGHLNYLDNTHLGRYLLFYYFLFLLASYNYNTCDIVQKHLFLGEPKMELNESQNVIK